MKFQRITIDDFRCIQHLEYEPQNVVACLKGPIGTGKTSFISAIQSGITGDLNRDNIRSGSQMAEIEMDLYDKNGEVVSLGRRIHKEKANQLRINHRNSKIKEGNLFIENLLNLSLDDFQIVSSSEVLEHMKPAELNDFLLKYIPDKMTLDKLLKIKGLSDVSAEEIKRVILEQNIPVDSIVVSDIKKIYALFRDMNRMLKQEIKQLEAITESYAAPKEIMSINEIDQNLKKILEDEAKFCAFEKQKQTIAQMRSRKAELEKSIAENKIKEIKYTSGDYQKCIARLQNTYNQFQQQIRVNENTIRTLNGYIKKMQTDRCPLHQDIKCSTDKSNVKNNLLATIKEVQQQNLVLKEEAAKLNYKIDRYTQTLQKVLEEEKQLQVLMSKKEELFHINDYLQKIQTQNQEIKKYDFEKYKQYYLQKKQEHEMHVKHQNDVKELQKKKEKKKHYDEIIQFLAMDGPAIQYITNYYLQLFNGTIQKRTKLFDIDLQITFVLENGISYKIQKKNENEMLRYHDLSTGEKKLVAFLILDLLNLLTGVRILFLDDLNDLDAVTFNKFLNFIMNPEFQENYDHIFLGMVDHKDMMDVLKLHKKIDYIY